MHIVNMKSFQLCLAYTTVGADPTLQIHEITHVVSNSRIYNVNTHIVHVYKHSDVFKT